MWFDSGTSWAGVVEAREGLHFPADLYLEVLLSPRLGSLTYTLGLADCPPSLHAGLGAVSVSVLLYSTRFERHSLASVAAPAGQQPALPLEDEVPEL